MSNQKKINTTDMNTISATKNVGFKYPTFHA